MASRAIPFPFPLHIGTDVCRIARIHAILRTPRATRFIRRVLNEEELLRPRDAIAKILEPKGAALLDGGHAHNKATDRGEGFQNSPLWDAAVFMAGR